jgi:hypothetical protein
MIRSVETCEGAGARQMMAIALNGSFFNTQRMVVQYVLKAYFG